MNIPKPEPKWHSLRCLDCKSVIVYSPEPLNCYQPVYCYLCAHSHADVADWMMPHGNKLGKQSLYAVGGTPNATRLRSAFLRQWDKLFAKLQQHQAAKVEAFMSANKNTS